MGAPQHEPHHQRFVELEKLLSQLHDGLASPQEIARIESILDGDPEACEFYIDYSQLVAGIEDEVAARPPLEVGSKTVPLAIAKSTALFFEGQNTRQILSPKWRPLTLGAAAAAVILAAGATFFLTKKNPLAPGEAVAEELAPGHSGVAVLMESVGASYGKGGQHPGQSGGVLNRGELRLESGLAEIEFYSGVRVLIESPAVFELTSDRSGYLHEGRMRVKVPSGTREFTLATAQFEIANSGSEFGISIHDDGHVTEIHCFDGSLDITEGGAIGTPQLTRQLSSDEAVRLRASGIRRIDADAMSFISFADLKDTALADASMRHERWRQLAEDLRSDADLIALYTFDEQGPRERSLVNEASYLNRATHGGIVGCRWTTGRWPSKGALEFSRASDRVTVQTESAYEQMTLSTWVRPDSLSNDRPNSLFSSNERAPGAFEWFLNPDGSLSLSVTMSNGNNQSIFRSPPILGGDRPLGEWHHLATVYDAAGGTATHYLDGSPVWSGKMDASRAIALTPARSEIGNGGYCDDRGHRPVRHFHGRIDEFALFGRALSAEKIAHFAEVGKPR